MREFEDTNHDTVQCYHLKLLAVNVICITNHSFKIFLQLEFSQGSVQTLFMRENKIKNKLR